MIAQTLPLALSQILPALPAQWRGLENENHVLPLPILASALPDGGLPRGAVVELACPHSLGQATSIALHACSSAQKQALMRGGECAWCAWLDPARTLYAPGVCAHGVALDRLLVVQPPLDDLPRVAVRLLTSRVFSVLIVDTLGVPGASLHVPLHRWPNVVRRLAIAARDGDTSVVLLTERDRARTVGLPVAMRIELEQPQQEQLRLKIAKERQGRITMPQDLAYTRPTLKAFTREKQRRIA